MHELSTNAMSCAKLMEFVYASRMKVLEALQQLQAIVNSTHEGSTKPSPIWVKDFGAASHASSLLSAHAHIVAAIASQRAECFSEHVRLLLTVGLRKLKVLVNSNFKLLWSATQSTPKAVAKDLHFDAAKWITECTELVDADLRTMRAVLKTWRTPAPEEANFYTHEADGRYSTMEALRRDTFEEYQMDKGLLRGLIRHIFPLDAVVADVGAGSGHYSKWLNDTGFVSAFAFDGSPDVELVTKGSVHAADLGRPLDLNRKFDWVMCIEVAEHIPPELTGIFLRNLDEHATSGVVLSWARPGLQAMGYANPRSEQDVLDLIRQHTRLHVNGHLTTQLRAASTVAAVGESLMVLVRDPNAPGVLATGIVNDAVAPGCHPEEGWIYSGNDIQMYSNVDSAAACCELCSASELCKFWTWSREESHKDLCWVKTTREYRINHDGFISGARAVA